MNYLNGIKLTLIILAFLSMGTGLLLAQESKSEKGKKVEAVEWCQIWVASARKHDKPRVLIIGDSIACGYYSSAAKNLKGKAYCSKFGTSVCVADPTFHKQLEAMLCQYKYDVIHFNNGLHEFGFTPEEYQAGYEQAINYIKKKSPSTKIILALTTPLKPGSSTKKKYPKVVDERNDVVRSLAKKYGLEINDLHSISKGHPEYYRDPFHYKKEAIELQGKQVGKSIEAAINKEKNK